MNALVARGKDFMARREWDAAYQTFAEVLAGQPAHLDALMQIGIIHYHRGDLEAAEAFHLRLLSLDPDEVNGWINIGFILKDQGRLEHAEMAYRRALHLDPQSAKAQFNLGCLLLAQGRWREGFAGYEWRATKAVNRPAALPALPEWGGQEPAGTRVLIWHDQGNGDALHFLRFVADVAGRGHRVTLQLTPPLKRLGQGVAGVESVVTPGEPLPEVDVQVSLASLPALLGIDDPKATWRGPYLTTPPGPCRDLAAKLKRPGRLAVGLVWAGHRAYLGDAERSLSLRQLESWLAVEGIDWFSLQVGPQSEERVGSPWAGRLVDLAPAIKDFADTGSLLQGLDLLISVDTAVAHLAGALHCPTWLMVRRYGDWRWQFTGREPGWYPTLDLFRQRHRGQWDNVVDEIGAHLALLQKSFTTTAGNPAAQP